MEHGWKKVSDWVQLEKGLFLSVYVDDITLAGKKVNIDPMWKVLNKEVDFWENQLYFLSMFTWVALKDIAKHANILLTTTEPCSNPDFPQEQWQNDHVRTE